MVSCRKRKLLISRKQLVNTRYLLPARSYNYKVRLLCRRSIMAPVMAAVLISETRSSIAFFAASTRVKQTSSARANKNPTLKIALVHRTSLGSIQRRHGAERPSDLTLWESRHCSYGPRENVSRQETGATRLHAPKNNDGCYESPSCWAWHASQLANSHRGNCSGAKTRSLPATSSGPIINHFLHFDSSNISSRFQF